MYKKIKRRIERWYMLYVKNISEGEYVIWRNRRNGIEIGDGCRITTIVSSNEPSLIHIGNRVRISSNVVFCTHDNAIIKVIPGKTDVVGEIRVEDDCFIGMNSILMYGITLGKGCIVGAGSVVTRSFPPYTVLAGNPARAICSAEQYANKYRDYAIDFSTIPMEERPAFFEAHPELIVKR